MILVYYRDVAGKIVRHHTVRDGETLENIQSLVEHYNDTYQDRTAYVQDIQEDSLEMYLFECAQKKKLFTEQTIEDAKDAIREALSAIECLEVAKEG